MFFFFNDWVTCQVHFKAASKQAEHFHFHNGKQFMSGWSSSKREATEHELEFNTKGRQQLELRNFKMISKAMKPLFNGTDLTGWTEFPGRKSKFTVTDKGEINVKNGNGDLQTVGKYKDFVLQLECKSNGKHLNSGIFF